jgi:hypothetical protein
MDIQDIRCYTMLARVKDFGAGHADLFPAESLGANTFAELGALVTRIGAHIATESSGRNEARKGALAKASARAALRLWVDRIVKTARGLAIDTADAAGAFRVPALQSDHELLTTAQRFAADAAPLSAAFVAHGLPGTFVADLQAAVDAFARAANARGNAKEAHIGARAAIRATIGSAFTLLQRLDAIVENRIGGDPDLAAAWGAARHVEQTARVPKRATPAGPAVSSATASTAPA